MLGGDDVGVGGGGGREVWAGLYSAMGYLEEGMLDDFGFGW